MSTTNTDSVVRGTLDVARSLGIPVWKLEQIVRDERIVIPHIGGIRVWSAAHVEQLAAALAARAARAAARRRRGPLTPEIRA